MVTMLPSSATVSREVVEVVEGDTEMVLSSGARTFFKHSLKYVKWMDSSASKEGYPKVRKHGEGPY